MDEREGIPSFYLNRGFTGSGSHAGSASYGGGFHVPPPGFKTQSNPNIPPFGHSIVRATSNIDSSLQIEHNPSTDFPHGINIGGGGGGGSGEGGGDGDDGGNGHGGPVATHGSGVESFVKKKRGRPRKYAPAESHMALGLTPPVAAAAGSPESITPAPKKNRGRPPGSGRKQRLANVGEWMHNSAGFAFTPHILHISAGEDVAAKIMSFAQQRPRALCILSGKGAVSVVTLRQFTPSEDTMTYEGHFTVLCLSGSYLVAEAGGPHNRTGGLSISVCSADGLVVGGQVGGRLIASDMVEVVVGSFVYDGGHDSKVKTTPSRDEEGSGVQLN